MPKKEKKTVKSNRQIPLKNMENKQESVKKDLSDYIYHTGTRKKTEGEKYKPISIRIHPMVLEWAKTEAQRRGIGYQSVINETLLEMIISS